MKHSIIIPHRNRLEHLRLCLASIERSAEATGIGDYEVIITQPSQTRHPLHGLPTGTRCSFHDDPMPVFNKAKLLNLGIEAAEGDVLTFLDADAIVGPRWLESVRGVLMWGLAEPLIRLCYRVRYVDARTEPRPMAEWFRPDVYPTFPRGYEAYCNPGFNSPEGKEPRGDSHLVFGNSQFSIRRDVLGDLRFDESYAGHGFEDLDFLYRLWARDKAGYRAAILTDPDHALIHLKHDYSPDWKDPDLTSVNLRRFLKVKMEV